MMLDIERWRIKRTQAEGVMPEYQFSTSLGGLDTLPIDTFLIATETGTGGYPSKVMRLVKPRDPPKYAPKKLTNGKNLLYVCWSKGKAVQLLETIDTVMTFRHIILPDHPAHAEVAAFKIACDHKRAMNTMPVDFSPALLLRALGWVNGWT